MSGEFKRKDSQFRQSVKKDGSTPFKPEAGRYHLYISLACPWASRAYLSRNLLGLEDSIGLSIVDPTWGKRGWRFTDAPGCIPDTVNGTKDLIDVYRLADPKFPEDEETVPVLWDKETKTIVNNESRDIIRMFSKEFTELSETKLDLAPEKYLQQIDQTIDRLYPSVNNGVYRAGFAKTQEAYEKAVRELFSELDYWENHLTSSAYLVGEQLTEADLCFFTTLIRFDPVYVGHFKCNLRRIADYPSLSRYLKQIYLTPGFRETVNLDHIKRHYYTSHEDINPTRIVPIGPELNLD
ncbi:MAG: glutathione S-transferase family protein [Proteobacteria bacterium]|nr:MAG: glutathione S-transferase family protein [Pseudomonadota bacterium]